MTKDEERAVRLSERENVLKNINVLLHNMEQTWLRQRNERKKPEEEPMFNVMINTAEFIKEQIDEIFHTEPSGEA